MTRWISRILLFMFAGVVINVLVTFACVLWAQDAPAIWDASFRHSSQEPHHSWETVNLRTRPGIINIKLSLVHYPDDLITNFGTVPRIAINRRLPGMSQSVKTRVNSISAEAPKDRSACAREFLVDARGWPFPSIQRAWKGPWLEYQPRGPWLVTLDNWEGALFGADRIDNATLDGTTLHTSLCWTEAAINTLLYAAASALLSYASMIVRSLTQRRLTLILLCALSGMVTTVAVAWSCAYWANPFGRLPPDMYTPYGKGKFVGQTDQGHVVFWHLSELDNVGIKYLTADWHAVSQHPYTFSSCLISLAPPIDPDASPESLVPSWAQQLNPVRVELHVQQVRRTIAAVGFPCVSMWWQLDEPDVTSLDRGERIYRRGFALHSVKVLEQLEYPGRSGATTTGRKQLVHRAMPLGVIWSGFVINSTLYAIAWFVLIAYLLLALRGKQLLRARRGLCMTCGYDLRGYDSTTCPECGAASVCCSS